MHWLDNDDLPACQPMYIHTFVQPIARVWCMAAWARERLVSVEKEILIFPNIFSLQILNKLKMELVTKNKNWNHTFLSKLIKILN